MEFSNELVVGVAIGLAIGLIIGYLVSTWLDTAKIRSLETVHKERTEELNKQISESATARDLIDNAKEQLTTEFQAIASQALQGNNEQFMQLADQKLSATMQTAQRELDQRHRQFQELVKPLAEDYGNLNPMIEQLDKRLQSMTAETANLSGALRGDNRAVGNWGEIQLRRVVDLAGMTAYCDFSEQQTTGNSQDRPDMVVNLPERRAVVVDAKASTAAYMEANQAVDEMAADAAWKRHASALRNQVNSLSGKRYGNKVDGALDFVVMFVPGDQFLAAALKASPDLVEYAMSRRVAIATPASLIAMLWAVANGWQQQEMAQNAEQIRVIGTEMHQRLLRFVDNYGTLRQRINQTVAAFNTTVGTLEGSVMVSARRMAELGVGDPGTLDPPGEILDNVRQLTYATDDQSKAA